MEEKHRETARFFKQSRKKLGLNQSKFARIVGMTRSYACNIEHGRRGMPGRTVLFIQDLLNDIKK